MPAPRRSRACQSRPQCVGLRRRTQRERRRTPTATDFPWEGGLRFWEVQLSVPGELDVYGAQLTGLPAVGIGFNEDVAWSHTVSDGNRFTAYKLRPWRRVTRPPT